MPLILLCLSFSIEQRLGWISFVVKPLSLEEDQEIRFVYRASAGSDRQQYLFRVYLENITHPNRLLIFANNEYLNAGEVKEISRLFILSNLEIDQSINILTFSCLSNGYDDEIQIEATIRHSSPFIISETNTQLTSFYNYNELRDGLLYVRRDKYIFYGFNDVIEDDYYYQLDLSSLSFYSENPFTYSDLSLLIEESGGLYRLFPKSVVIGFRELPIQIVAIKRNVYAIRFANLLVDPDTLMMSPNKKEGFIQTNNFYFPKEHYETERNINLKIIIKKCGYNEIDIIYNFSYFSNLRFMGDCQNSQYCIGVSSTEDNTMLGEWLETNI